MRLMQIVIGNHLGEKEGARAPPSLSGDLPVASCHPPQQSPVVEKRVGEFYVEVAV